MLKTLKNALSVTLILLQFFYCITPTHAADIQPASNPLGQLDMALVRGMIGGDFRVTKNDMASVLIDIPAGKTANETIALAGPAVIVWARYYPLNNVGTIQTTRVFKNPKTGGVTVYVKMVKPSDGARWSRAGGNPYDLFGGVNPFAKFEGGNGLFNGISKSAFQTVVGMFAQANRTTKGMIAIAQQRDDFRTWDECTLKVLKACLRKRYHQEMKTYVKPAWTVITAADNARGRSYLTAYKVDGCTGTDKACTAMSGVAFLDASEGNTYASSEALMSEIEHHQDGWTGLALMLAFAVIAIVAAPLLVGSPGFVTLALNSAVGGVATVSSLGAAFALEAIGYAAVSVALNGSFDPGAVQDGFAGRSLSDGAMAAHELNSEWDMRTAVTSKFITPAIQDVGGGVGQVYQQLNHKEADGYQPSRDVLLLRSNPLSNEPLHVE